MFVCLKSSNIEGNAGRSASDLIFTMRNQDSIDTLLYHMNFSNHTFRNNNKPHC